MDHEKIQEVVNFLEKEDIPVFGAASSENINRLAPVGFRPVDYLPGAMSVIIIGKPLPVSVFLTPPENRNMFYVNAFSTYYKMLDEVAVKICLLLEAEGHAALPIPSYNPIRFHEGEPRGLISLKHTAEEAGLGKIGKNQLLIHPQFGNVLRLSGVVTSMEWPADEKPAYKAICPKACRECEKHCPVGALEGGAIDKLRCMNHCLEHLLLPPMWMAYPLKWFAARSRRLRHVMENFAFNFFENYGIGCVACVKACPHFPKIR